MAYNQDRDKVLKVFEMPQENGNFFIVSIFSYDGGKPKLQFSRRFEKSDGTSSYKASGRMTIEETNSFSNGRSLRCFLGR